MWSLANRISKILFFPVHVISIVMHTENCVKERRKAEKRGVHFTWPKPSRIVYFRFVIAEC